MSIFNIAALGASVAEQNVNVIANNIANANTTAFQKQLLLAQDLQYNTLPVKSLAEVVPSNIQFGSGVRTAAIVRDNQQGDTIQTSRQFDFRISGKGFFVVNLQNGDQRFTRDGSFLLSPEGQIVTKEGYLVSPGITIPDNSTRVTLKEDGTVLSDIGNNEPPQELGQLEIVKFVNPDGLESQGGNFFTFSQASGNPIFGVGASDDFGKFVQGELEGSNVKAIVEMTNLIKNQRIYEMNVQLLQKADQMFKKATDV